MYRPLIRNRITIYFIVITGGALLFLGLYTLYAFKEYSEKNFIDSMFIHARYSRDVLYGESPDIRQRDRLNTLAFNLGDSMGLDIEVIGQSGAVIAASRPRSANAGQLEKSEVASALTGNFGWDIRPDDTGQKTAFVAVPFTISPPYQAVVRVSQPAEELYGQFAGLARAIAAAFLVALFLAAWLSVRLAKRLVRPLEEITDSAAKMSAGQLDERIHYKGDGEFALLSHVLNNLAANLSQKIHETSAEKQKLELILQNMDNPVLLFDKNGRVSAANRHGQQLFGPNLLGQHQLAAIGSSVLDTAIRSVQDNSVAKSTTLKLTFNGLKYIFQVFVASLPAGQNILCVFHDITALQNIYEKQMEFVANASHELATPLTAIRGFSETLLDGGLGSTATNIKFIKIIHEESERMQRLLADLLRLARLDAADYRQAIALSPIAAEGLLEEVLEEFSNQCQHKNISLSIDYQRQPGSLLANRDWLKQALVNLTENAVKYSPEGGKIMLTYDADDACATFSVSDSGLGIAPENLPLVFERFYQVDKARVKGNSGGTGLGLAIVKSIVEMLGGTVKVESRLKIGTTFSFTVPLNKILVSS